MEILDPTPELTEAQAQLAPRLEGLEGRTVGLLSNGKAGVEPFFDHVERLLRDEHGVAEVVRRTKGNYSAPAEPELIAELVGWDAVLAGVGD